jgi:hypothetical protein
VRSSRFYSKQPGKPIQAGGHTIHSDATLRTSMSPDPDQTAVDVYVFGAGASHVHGAPITDTILPYAFVNIRNSDRDRFGLIARFLAEVFRFDVRKFDADSSNPARNRYPGLVDILSTVDLALDRKENLAPGYDLARLHHVRDALNYAIFAALEHSLLRSQERVTYEFFRKINLSKAVFISLNYDVIADIALADALQLGYDDTRPEPYPVGLIYGIEFANVRRPITASRVPLLKLHGSFNWLWSRMTGRVYYGGLRKAIGDIYRQPINSLAQYPEPMDDLEPILITPTHLKDLRNVYLAEIWRAAEDYVRRAGQLTFIGYSLPGDDLHIKYLFKRGIAGRLSKEPPKITVVDFASGRRVTSVQQNYQRFFVGKVEYYRNGFKRYVEDEFQAKGKSPRRKQRGV